MFEDISMNDCLAFGSPREEFMTIVNGDRDEAEMNVRHGSLLHFHRRLGRLCYDKNIKMARDPASGTTLTDTKRLKWLACAKGKQTKNMQSRKDSGMNSPIYVIGRFIFFDRKESMTSTLFYTLPSLSACCNACDCVVLLNCASDCQLVEYLHPLLVRFIGRSRR